VSVGVVTLLNFVFSIVSCVLVCMMRNTGKMNDRTRRIKPSIYKRTIRNFKKGFVFCFCF